MNSDANSAVKPTSSSVIATEEQLCKSIRLFSKVEVSIQKDNVLGSGMFGKCYHGSVGPVAACVKVSKVKIFDYSFIREANMLSSCCHPNVSYLLGVCNDARYKMLILSFHGISHQSFSLHSVLISSNRLEIPSVKWNWKSILFGIINGLSYIHSKNILHNDIKEDNVVLEERKGIIIDFGKACYEKDGKRYVLSQVEKKKYMVCHPQVAPDLRDGLCHQNKSTDIYSFGRLLHVISDKAIPLPALVTLSKVCMDYSSLKRPTTSTVFTSLSNLLN